MTRRRTVGTFDLLTRLNVAACCAALAGVVVAVASWRLGVDAYVAAAFGAVMGAGGAVGRELRRGAAGRPRAMAALVAAWAILLGPIAWLVVALVLSVGGR